MGKKKHENGSGTAPAPLSKYAAKKQARAEGTKPPFEFVDRPTFRHKEAPVPRVEAPAVAVASKREPTQHNASDTPHVRPQPPIEPPACTNDTLAGERVLATVTAEPKPPFRFYGFLETQDGRTVYLPIQRVKQWQKDTWNAQKIRKGDFVDCDVILKDRGLAVIKIHSVQLFRS